MERVFRKARPRAAVVPYMLLGSTDGADLRAKGMAVYGVPLFAENDRRAHGNDERMALATLEEGRQLLWQIVLEVAAGTSR